MSAQVRTNAPAPLQRLDEVITIDGVVRNLDLIIAWAIREQSTIGYFAVLYKRSTLAVRKALEEGQFNDRERMEKFDAVFAQRYFDALNAYFHPGGHEPLTLPWEVAFVGHEIVQSTMLQHMVAGLNAHINFDLGIAAKQMVPDSLDTFEHDFNLINALVAAQIPGMLNIVEGLSPAVLWIRRAIPNEVGVIKRLLVKFRTAGWYFAIGLALNPNQGREKVVNQQAWTAGLGAWYLQPPGKTLIPQLVRAIAKRESKDTAGNLRALDGITNCPEEMSEAFL